MQKKHLFGFISVLIGITFIFSGYTKLYPIEPFEYTFVDLGFVNWEIAPFLARLIIGLEFLIGIFLILNINLKSIFKLGISLLLVFNVYLTLIILFKGNNGNCGCFGETLIMTPLQATVKNVVIIALFLILYKFHEGWTLKDKLRTVTYLLYVITLGIPFILNPLALDYSEAYLNQKDKNYKLELDSLYNHATLNIPPKTLSDGKHVISFLSLTCSHCRVAAKKIRIIHERNPNISFYFVLNGKDQHLEEFYNDTQTQNIPHCLLKGKPFIHLAGTTLPKILLINKSIVEHDVNYIDLNQKEIEKWLLQ